MNSNYINRELSLLEFHKRVLAQALDPEVPLDHALGVTGHEPATL